jgi:nuclear pore complex protein Nup133
MTTDLPKDGHQPYVKPSDALGVFTTQLDRRFSSMDETFQNKLLDVMKADDAKLRTYIEKHQLEAWYISTKECADRTVADAYRRLTAAIQGPDPDRPVLFGGLGSEPLGI